MNPDNEWDYVRGERSRFENAGIGALRITLLFGSAAIALALIAAPILDGRTSTDMARGGPAEGLDMTSTGTIGYKGSYTIRRSVLQASPNSICVIRDNGTRSGDC